MYSEVLPLDAHLIKASAYLSAECILDIGTEERFDLGNKLIEDSNFINSSYLFPQKALLLDRDGVVIQTNEYITKKEDIFFNKELIEFLGRLKKSGIKIGIITNQPHISQGRLNQYKHLEIKNYIIKELSRLKAIDFYYECKHYPLKGFNGRLPYSHTYWLAQEAELRSL